ncbi:MAG: hypothetical protein ACE5EO_07435 [Candidatus Krumholzibacteriia bacterium]
MKRLVAITVCALVAPLFAGCGDDAPLSPAVAPQPLARLPVSTSGGSIGITDSVLIRFSISATPFAAGSGSAGDTAAPILEFVNIRISNADNGKTRAVGPSNTPDFATAVGVLTNGVDDFAQLILAFTPAGQPPPPPMMGSAESAYINGGLLGNYDPDFKGAEITGVSVVVRDVQIASPGRDPNGDGNWTDVTLDANLVIMGRP